MSTKRRSASAFIHWRSLSSSSGAMAEWDAKTEIRFFSRHLGQLPSAYADQDTNRLTILYFACGALDLLRGRSLPSSPSLANVLDEPEAIHKIRDWVYAQQVIDRIGENRSGFIGGPYLGLPFQPEQGVGCGRSALVVCILMKLME